MNCPNCGDPMYTHFLATSHLDHGCLVCGCIVDWETGAIVMYDDNRARGWEARTGRQRKPAPELKSYDEIIEDKVGDTTAQQLRALYDDNQHVREQAARVLGVHRVTEAIEQLVDVLLHDGEFRVRKQAAWALGYIKDARAIPALITAIYDDNESSVASKAEEALIAIGEPAIQTAAAAFAEREPKWGPPWRLLDKATTKPQSPTTAGKLLSCPKCGLPFKRDSDLKEHIANWHPS